MIKKFKEWDQEAQIEISRCLFSPRGPGNGATKEKHKGIWGTDERLHPWVGQSTEKWSRKWGKGGKFAFSLIRLNNNSRLNPQEFGLSPRKGMNLIIFDPLSNKRAFKL